ncbi:SUMF1/EgtB/PvdO family nonheme iron enzyme [uncultured Algimonas sp.]|uniref:formylglycine-generating enzyme family protein n=1 Tax=uncultured Algimonas sp. TaxID=1547920 RepID=UPI00262B4795|nr:SUMF1/EgtB/PvdO family nonheme iron enzyme [uncultured Algimonas sp.]
MSDGKTKEDWTPPSDDFDVREERAPWGRYLIYAVLLGAVAAGGIWLASQVVVTHDIPDQARIDLPAEQASEAPPMGADEAAWVAALEKDTLEGYRDYLDAFPDGRFADKAQEQIDAYDNRAWETAEQRNTIAGYEDYLADWEDGLHADTARERVAQMKAARDAAAADAAERAAQERADWERAARENTVASYEAYLAKHPAGPNADEARARISAMQASAADKAAWQAAEAAGTADAYQQYLTSFPQGAHVASAIAALERLRPSVGKTFRDCDACPSMTVLPGGNDVLGAADTDDSARANEKPARPVTFQSPFAMSVHEVTFAQYDACVAAGGCGTRPGDEGWGRGSRPVVNVAFADAQSYAAWLSQETGFAYALPSEAQWEYAARAGANDVHPGGSPEALCAFANGASSETSVAWANRACTDPGVSRTLPVGTLSANGFGLRDMIGNVAEWTLDCNTLNLRDAPVDGRPDARGSCGQRVVRGGSWFSGADDLRYSARSMLRRGDRNDFTGFRVVRNLD